MAMKWIPLDGKKEPEFNVKMIILLGEVGWQEVTLKKIESLATGKVYTFCKVLDTDLEYTTASHYMIPEPPKNNQ